MPRHPRNCSRERANSGFRTGCENSRKIAAGQTGFLHGDPQPADYAYILQEGKGPLGLHTATELYTRACAAGWSSGCGDLDGAYLRGEDVPVDKARAATLLTEACAGGHARSCANLGLMYKVGDGVKQDLPAALSYLRKACDLGMANACRWLAAEAR